MVNHDFDKMRLAQISFGLTASYQVINRDLLNAQCTCNFYIRFYIVQNILSRIFTINKKGNLVN